ncbi:phenylalanine--tRNA ligase subunit beta [Humibacter ginsenosidimutans]|uniref:Phenylalanine--tRNA ligase beta subunit n=1 Tax=Humibacter ginsenosidimutans TaxID=2599293 RepID=A0A5B8LZP6_9MICO|nr:phenylalanine--tRNA ligase subunit beta [Humibacter ginsenosidimutans]QDZ13536.1 phenylalanine--tRNA ligase subunit beta [Humibacter ginsenosidimutans]
MRIPLSWLAEYVDVAPGSTPEDVHAALVKVGLEEEAIHRFEISGPVVVGQVLDFVEEPQTNGKTIRWCQVRVAPEGETAADGGESVHGIVCGAHNFFPGDKVVVTLPGSVLPGPFPIAARKTYGHVSDGMIASARELGLGDEHNGILRLAELGIDAPVGADAIGLLGLDDASVEVNVTPDRGYALSIRGVAREYAHSTGAAFRDPAAAVQPADGEGFTVVVDDRAPIRGQIGASVFVTRVVRGVDPSAPTPAWMIARLVLAGIRSISLIVDVTNYVMVELGQPTHAYDLDKLTGGITVRRAEPGETIETLDAQVRKLDPEDLLITDGAGPIGLAGVMGGATTEVSDTTTDVLIEAANFDPVSIARSARRHKLPSEASRRFERGVDPDVARAAAARVVQLLEQLGGGHADGLGSTLHTPPTAQAILLPHGYVSTLVGVEFTDDEVRSTLAEIGGIVEQQTDGGLLVTPPSWRPDLGDKADLAEEVARIVGYERIPSVLPVAPPGRGLTRSQQLRRQAATALAASGLTEVLVYPFVTAEQNNTFGSAVDGEVPAVRLANALDASVPFMRTSLLPGLVDTAKRNLSRGLTDLALFEIGLVFRPDGAVSGSAELPAGAALPAPEVIAELEAGIPAQPRRAGAIFTGDSTTKQPGQAAVAAGIADALVALRTLTTALGVEVAVRQGTHKALHPGRTAEIVLDGEVIGYAGELLPALAESSDLPRVVGVLEVDLDRLIEAAGGDARVSAISTFPAATQDLSLVVDAAVPAGDVLAAVVEGAGELLEAAHIVDDYRGQGVSEGTKSLTFALRFRGDDRTLTAAEASEAKLAGAALAGERFGAHARE